MLFDEILIYKVLKIFHVILLLIKKNSNHNVVLIFDDAIQKVYVIEILIFVHPFDFYITSLSVWILY